MRNDHKNIYTFAATTSKLAKQFAKGLPTTVGIPGTKNVLLAYESTAGLIHEIKHGAQHAQGKINAYTQSIDIVHEVEAYRAELAYSGRLSYPSVADYNCLTDPLKKYDPSNYTRTIKSIDDVDENLIKDIGEHPDGLIINPLRPIYDY